MIKFRHCIFFVLLSLVIFSCKKEMSNSNESSLLYTETINGIKKNEPVSFTFGDDNITKKVIWTVTPNNNFTMSSVANNAAIIFSQSGNYKVTAKFENVYAEYNVSVDNIDFTPDYGSNFGMTASKLVNININEPIVFSIHNPITGNSLGWSVYSNSYNLTKDDVKKTATITFTSGGYGVVTGDDGINSERRTVWINDSNNTSPNLDTVPFIIGDKLLITPSVEQTTTGKKLVLTASTQKKYHCNTDKILSFNFNNEYIIDYSGVVVSNEPCNPRSAATCINSFKNIQIGNHPFIINFGNKTYTGSFNLNTLGQFTFTWLDTSQVDIKPLSVN